MKSATAQRGNSRLCQGHRNRQRDPATTRLIVPAPKVVTLGARLDVAPTTGAEKLNVVLVVPRSLAGSDYVHVSAAAKKCGYMVDMGADLRRSATPVTIQNSGSVSHLVDREKLGPVKRCRRRACAPSSGVSGLRRILCCAGTRDSLRKSRCEVLHHRVRNVPGYASRVRADASSEGMVQRARSTKNS